MFLLTRIWRRLANAGRKLDQIEARQEVADKRLEYIQEALGRIEFRQLRDEPDPTLQNQEFRVFSQWGEDGIIQFLLRHIPIHNKVFVEFGVEDYAEANTRFLLVNNNWAGLVLDSSGENIHRLKQSRVYWAYNLKAVQAFITRDNINDLLRDNGVTGDIGLLSIDIDGNDYWVWEAITAVNPVIVIVEYNHRYGRDLVVTIPYVEDFNRRKAHKSAIYFGASLGAFCLLAGRKGYAFVGCNSNGINAFFVRRDMMPDNIREVSLEEGYVAGHHRESQDERGEFVRMSPEEERQLLLSMPLVYLD